MNDNKYKLPDPIWSPISSNDFTSSINEFYAGTINSSAINTNQYAYGTSMSYFNKNDVLKVSKPNLLLISYMRKNISKAIDLFMSVKHNMTILWN